MDNFKFEEISKTDLDYIEILKNTSLFESFTKDDLYEFISSINHKIACLKKDDILFFEGDTFPYLCICWMVKLCFQAAMNPEIEI